MGHPLRFWIPTDWPSFQGTPKLVGTTPGRVSVFVDPALGVQGLNNAQELLKDADRVMMLNDGLFRTGHGAVYVVVFALGGMTDGTGGADHMACDYRNGGRLECDATFSAPNPGPRLSALFEAELSECSMKGNLCGVSTGEALSRWLAAHVSGNALSDFATAPAWDSAGRKNYVDFTDPTDQNAESTGCGMAFLSWLRHMGCDLGLICRTMVTLGAQGNLAELYADLMKASPNEAWAKFTAALPAIITTDDPFGAGF